MADRLLRRAVLSLALDQAWRDARGDSSTAVLCDEEEGHEFHGNQYTDVAGSGKPKMSIAQFAKQKLSEGHSAAKVAEMAQKAFGSKTTAASVAWYKSQMNKEKKASGGEAIKKAEEKPGSIASIVQQHMPKPAGTEKPYGGLPYEGMTMSQKMNTLSAAKAVVSSPAAAQNNSKEYIKALAFIDKFDKEYKTGHQKEAAETFAKAAHSAKVPTTLAEAEKAVTQANKNLNEAWTKAINKPNGSPEHIAYQNALAEQSKAQEAAQKMKAAAPKGPTPVMKESDYIGGKAYYKMTPGEKMEATTQALHIVENPSGYTDTQKLAAHMYLDKHSAAMKGAEQQAEHEKKSAQKAAANAVSTVEHLTDKQHKSARDYTGSAAASMNKRLREGGEATPAIKHLDEAIAGAKLKADTVLYRGIPAEAAKAMFPGGIVQTGQEVTDKGFSSTSLSKQVASNFSRGVILHINAPKGAPALDVRHLSLHPGEEEVVLPRDAKLRVVGVLVPESSKDHLHVKVEYVH